MEHLPAIISAIGTVVAAWFAYNQYTKNKLVDLKIEKWKIEQENRNEKRSDSIAKIFGHLWQLLHYLKADRVYIAQPHPLVNNLFISISLEVRRNGVSELKSEIQNLSLSDIANFASDLSTREWMIYRNVDEEVKDKRVRAIMGLGGTESVVIKRLSTDKIGWIGSLFVEYTTQNDISNEFVDYTKSLIAEAAGNIQYILPEYK